MSNQRAPKRQRNPPQNDGKRIKMSLTDIEQMQELILNTPRTATTMNLIHKKLVNLEELKLSSTMVKDSHSLLNSHPEDTTEDVISSQQKPLRLPISPQKSRSTRIRTQDSGNSAEEIDDQSDSSELHCPSTSSKHDSSGSVDISRKDRFNPKNIKSPTATSKSSPLSLKSVLNKNKCPQANLPRVVGSTSTSQLNQCSSENIEPSCSHSVFLENQGPIIKTDVGKERQRKSPANIFSGPSNEFSKNTKEKNRCEKCEEEEMLLFFWRLLPLTTVLSEEKKQEFKATVRTTLEQLMDK